ncbi:MAG: DNA polymerase III subunit epsilon [Magnetospiraceae bacterium]
MREIALDTETTGLDPAAGHRVVEIGCVELINRLPTGRVYHQYLNPDRAMPEEAQAVHGLSEEFLADKPRFAEVAQDFLDFIQSDTLVIHNADFDMGFLNAELARLGLAALPKSQAVDTVRMARDRFPGARASLDALCKRFGIDNSERTLHGALLDADLLASVYLELTGGRQPGLALAATTQETAGVTRLQRVSRPPRPHAASPQEEKTHAEFLKKLKDPIWLADG